MEKMQFENGTLVTPAKVTIDGVDHTVTPAVYEGNTPFTAENINQMQDNIETNRYKITLEADLADNSELTIPANYKVRNRLSASILWRLFVRKKRSLLRSRNR